MEITRSNNHLRMVIESIIFYKDKHEIITLHLPNSMSGEQLQIFKQKYKKEIDEFKKTKLDDVTAESAKHFQKRYREEGEEGEESEVCS